MTKALTPPRPRPAAHQGRPGLGVRALRACASGLLSLVTIASLTGCSDTGAATKPTATSTPQTSTTPRPNSAAGPSSQAPPAAVFEQREACDNASDYLYGIRSMAGQTLDPISTQQSLKQLTGFMLELSKALSGQVPPTHRSQARTAYRSWVATRNVYEKYDYNVPSSANQELLDLATRYRSSNTAYNQYLISHCKGSGDDFAQDYRPLAG